MCYCAHTTASNATLLAEFKPQNWRSCPEVSYVKRLLPFCLQDSPPHLHPRYHLQSSYLCPTLRKSRERAQEQNQQLGTGPETRKHQTNIEHML